MSKVTGFATDNNCCRGPIGPPGPQGVTGDIGNNGASGLSGLTGNTGLTGLTGAIGITGTTGNRGIYDENIFCSTLSFTGPTGATAVAGDFVSVVKGTTFASVSKLNSNAQYEWATKVQGMTTTTNFGKGIDTDYQGNSYVTGYFQGTVTFGSFTLTSSGSNDIFVGKIDSSMNWIWVRRAGGKGSDLSNSINIDCDGNCYITGSFSDTATFGSFLLTANGLFDIFVSKLDTNGNWLWATNTKGTTYGSGNAISVNCYGNSFVTGSFGGTIVLGSITLTANGTQPDIFITQLDTNGNWIWARSAGSSGGNGIDLGLGISADYFNNCYVTGRFRGTANFGILSVLSSGIDDIFVTKLNSNGDFLWVNRAGGINADFGNAIIVDSYGNGYITGSFNTTSTFGNITLISARTALSNVFVAKINSSGVWKWATQSFGTLTGTNNSGNGICIDCNANCYITGKFGGTITFGNYTLTATMSSASSIFISKIDTNGNWLWALESENIINNTNVEGASISIDNNENIYVTGNFTGTAFFGSNILTAGSTNEIFITKIKNKNININPKGVISTTATVGDSVKTCFLNGNIVSNFSNISSGYQYYLDDNSNTTPCVKCGKCNCIGVSLSNMQILGNICSK